MAIKAASLDTRLKHGLLNDPKLNLDLSDAEFRAFIRLLVWSVSLVSDGAFLAEDARMIAEREHIDRLTEAGVLEYGDGWHRIHTDYWEWQTSKAELDRLSAKREADKLRKQKERAADKPKPEPAPEPAFEAEQPF